MSKPVLGALALALALLGGWRWAGPDEVELVRALQASEFRDDLREAHTSLLGAHVDLYERNFPSARRRLEEARGRLRRAEERGRRLGWRDEVTRLDLASFEADLDEAQRLLRRLDQEANSLVPEDQGILEGVLAGSAFLRQ